MNEPTTAIEKVASVYEHIPTLPTNRVNLLGSDGQALSAGLSAFDAEEGTGLFAPDQPELLNMLEAEAKSLKTDEGCWTIHKLSVHGNHLDFQVAKLR